MGRAVYYTYHYSKGKAGVGRVIYRPTMEELIHGYPTVKDIHAIEARLMMEHQLDHVLITWWKTLEDDDDNDTDIVEKDLNGKDSTDSNSYSEDPDPSR